MKYEKGELVAEGKTKKIYRVVGSLGDLVIVQNKEDITAFDDPSKTRTFKTKSVFATTTTCRVFELLKKAGIPIAYQEQISPTEFVALNCQMIKLEVVARRYAVGSYLKRHPELTKPEGKPPHRFHRLVAELFLKTTGGKFLGPNGEIVIEGLDPQKGEEDPLIVNPLDPEKWRLFHSKKPTWDHEANLHRAINSDLVVRAAPASGTYPRIARMDSILRKVFLVLEGAWNTLGLHFIDLKIEFGIDPAGNLIVADVIDNDSWRLRDENWQELSKEAFRQGEELGEVEKKYGIVANLIERIRIPRQVLVLWKGSEKDESPKIDAQLRELIDVREVIISGHKSTGKCLQALEETMRDYPDGGVIVTKVGRSNGLGPILAAHTTWPVIAIPATIEEHPEDIWSSIRMPSSVPLLTVWPESNAVLAAQNILAIKNPLLYAKLQEQIEELDS